MKTDKQSAKILKILLKDLTIKPTITELARELGMSRTGVWKALKRLETEKFVVLSPVGAGKTSTFRASLNWENPLTEKNLALILAEDALKNQRWMSNFAELENNADFLILYGSIIFNPKEANDIDILAIASKNKFLEIEESIKKIQKTQIKKIHILSFTQEEFRQELEKPNKVFIDAVKKGIFLFGQENFVKFIRGVTKK